MNTFIHERQTVQAKNGSNNNSNSNNKIIHEITIKLKSSLKSITAHSIKNEITTPNKEKNSKTPDRI